jgi:hypothetical protein
MSKTILTEVEGWTPLIDDITKAMGITISAVFGRVWRYCQMESEVCYASQQTIAGELGITRETVSRSCKALVEAGYLEEVDAVGFTKTYRDTGKAGFKMVMSASSNNRTACDLKSQPQQKPPKAVTINHMGCDLKSQGVTELITEPVTFNHTKIDSNIGVKREGKSLPQFFCESFSTPDALLEAIKKTIKPAFDQTNWQRKIAPLWVHEYDEADSLIVLGLENEPACDWLNQRCRGQFGQAARGLTNRSFNFTFRVLDRPA